MLPSGVDLAQTPIRPAARRLAVASAAVSSLPIWPPRRRAGLAACGGGGPVSGRLGDEDHVDVADVVQLAGTALAHGHHGQTARRGPGGQLGPGHGERRLEDRGGDVGQLLDHLLDADHRGHVARGQVQQAAPVRRGQRRDRLAFGVLARDRLGQAGVGADGQQHLLAQFGRPGAADGPAEDLGVFGVPGQVVGQAGADAENGGQPVAEVGFVVQPPAQGGPVVRGAEHAGQPGQGQVGIGRRGQRGEQRIGARLARLLVRIDAEVGEQQALGSRGVRETQPGQSPGQRGPRAAHPAKVVYPLPFGNSPRATGARPGRDRA